MIGQEFSEEGDRRPGLLDLTIGPVQARHVDSIWPIWNVLDVTAEGRGSEPNFPSLRYD